MHRSSDLFVLYHVQRTPLHIAAGNGHDDTVLYFADQRADVSIKDNNGVSKLELITLLI